MFKKMQKTVCALAVLAATTTSVMAAESVDVKVTGTVSPSACTPTLSGGGLVDYGTIKASTISADAYTVLDWKSLNFNIHCDAPAKVAVKAVNNRPNTAAGVTESPSGAGPSPVQLQPEMPTSAVVGLGMADTAKIGGYTLQLTDAKVDGNDVANIWQRAGDPTWIDNAGNYSLYGKVYSTISSWGAAGTLEPVAFQDMSAKIDVRAYINKGSQLDLTKEIALDGMSTIEIVYL
ncbi:DUF1120 domain-containing protein [Enterobacteriaceae bacterium H11S18]|uniref:DUF1120 domain-containing protein n=1 Tax=Dryocola clanedunensis TaxID=2925396 RepID=UPI0022F0A06B|nr:DUF1120 domain-containing protein [Dryocola clanedunensis]MCT4704950.1 DUF1120 domain-containing protein [Dryocola clanedunensis]MCT4712100.1 DUF1120 domain-containing protein [Dryocola clanedunensis]